jgi:uncharacterized protein YecA (UPF0149 family)
MSTDEEKIDIKELDKAISTVKKVSPLTEKETHPKCTPPVVQRRVVKIGRNEKCPCGSGNKYKRCCINKEQ